jgi:hypothetical protein
MSAGAGTAVMRAERRTPVEGGTPARAPALIVVATTEMAAATEAAAITELVITTAVAVAVVRVVSHFLPASQGERTGGVE